MSTPILRLDARGSVETEDILAVEEPLDIRVNGRPFSLTMRTPGNDEDLALGLLFAEGIIETAGDVLGISRNSNSRVDIAVSPSFDPARFERKAVTNSACGICGLGEMACRTPVPRIPPSGFSISAEALCALPAALAEQQDIFRETGGLHAAACFDSVGRVLGAREDVGRHNAVDKLIGCAVRDGRLPLSSCGLLVSGRIAFEIVQKAARAGIPFLAAIGAPTSLSVQCAGAAGISLAGFLRADRANIYTGQGRVKNFYAAM
ncbi:MAG: formate dehydrogenase accessory sulfurtransferase FdhD [Terrimicrobiaceae bacterium]